MDRAALHDLVDRIPDSQVDQAAALFEAVRTQDRTLIQALLAEEESLEPGDADALAEVDRKDTISGEEIEHRYGLM